MNDKFEKLIRDSAPEIPDPDEYRRLNRVHLRERLHEMEKPKRRHSLVVATACLALMVLFSGQISNLGSDSFDLISEPDTTLLGNETTVHTNSFSGYSFTATGSDQKISDIQQAFAAQDGKLTSISCLAYGGKQKWKVNREAIIEGEIRELTADNPEWLPRDDLDQEIDFFLNYYRDLLDRSKTLRPDQVSTMTVFGVEFTVHTWKHTYPSFGEVTYSRGNPTE